MTNATTTTRARKPATSKKAAKSVVEQAVLANQEQHPANMNSADSIEVTTKTEVTADFNRWCYRGKFPDWMVAVAKSVAAEFKCSVEVVKKTSDYAPQYPNYHYVVVHGTQENVDAAQKKYQEALDSMIMASDQYWITNKDQLKDHGVTPQKAKNAWLLEQANNLQ